MVPSSSGTTTTTGFCSYTSSDHHHLQPYHHHHHQIQPPSFVSDPEEIFINLTAGMEMIGFHKNHHLLLHQQPHVNNNNTVQWKSIISKPAGQGQGQGQGQQHLPHQPSPSSSKTMNHESTPNIYHQQQQDDHFTSGISETTSSDQNLIHDEWRQQQHENNNNNIRSLIVDADSSSSSSVLLFPSTTTCEGNETTRPSQAGLSLSLSNSNINPSTFSSHSFPLRQTTTTHQNQNQNQMMLLLQQQQQDGYLNNANKAALYHYNHGQQQHHHQFVLKNSKYLLPAQELLNEFCSSLDTKQGDLSSKQQQKSQKQYSWELEEDHSGGTRTGSTTSSSKKHSLTSIEFTELQKRKTKLLSMLEEVDRRYRHYRNQMKAVVSSFEGVAGNGAAKVYSALALKAMSRHFKCLKDGILGQIETTRKSLGEKDIINNIPVGGETTQTPRLKIIDQTLRQQRAFQQMSLMESTTHPWRPQRGLPERSVSVLRAWLFDHFLHPYPSDVDKHILSRQTGLSRSQVSNWFINARVRLWKPMVEEMYLEETKENENNINDNIILPSSDWISTDPTDDHNVVQNQNLGDQDDDDQKPTPDRLVRIDSAECPPPPPPSSSIMDPTIIKNNTKTIINNPQVVTTEMSSFGSVVELDFSSYTQQHQHSSGVSLTLGLQQHAYGGTGSVSLAFPSQINNHHQSSLLYSSRDHQIDQDHCDQSSVVQYMDGDDDDDQDHHGQNQLLPYRNLMGAQLLHDLAG